MLKRQNRTGEIAISNAGVAFLNQLLCGCDLLRIYIRNNRLVDGDLRQLTRGISECRDNRRYRRRIVDLEQLTDGGYDRSEHHAAVIAQV